MTMNITATVSPLRQAHADALGLILARRVDQTMTLARDEADFLGDTWTLRVLQQAANDLVRQGRATFVTDLVGRISVRLIMEAAELGTTNSNT